MLESFMTLIFRVELLACEGRRLFFIYIRRVERRNMFSDVNRKRIAAFKVLKFENVLHFSLEKYCRFQK